jgi:hypothetical protein
MRTSIAPFKLMDHVQDPSAPKYFGAETARQHVSSNGMRKGVGQYIQRTFEIPVTGTDRNIEPNEANRLEENIDSSLASRPARASECFFFKIASCKSSVYCVIVCNVDRKRI